MQSLNLPTFEREETGVVKLMFIHFFRLIYINIANNYAP